jgi:hypothetical protein
MGGFVGMCAGMLLYSVNSDLGGRSSSVEALVTILTAIFAGALAGAAGMATLFVAIMGGLLAVDALWQACAELLGWVRTS